MKKSDIERIIEMAWEDRTPFDAIKVQFGLNEQAVKELRKLGFYKSLNKTANSVLNRLKKSK